MSWQAVADVLDHSPSYGADRLVELAIAERADEHGQNSYGSMADIARRANLTRFREVSADDPDYLKRYDNATRAARRSVRNLQDLGRVQAYGATSRGVALHRILFGRLPGVVTPDTMSGVDGSTPDTMSGEGDTTSGVPRTPCPVTPDTMSPKPSLNHPLKSQSESEQHFHQDQKSEQQVEAEERDEALSALWEQLPKAKGPLREQTARAITRLEAETAPTVEHEVDMWASRLAVAA